MSTLVLVLLLYVYVCTSTLIGLLLLYLYSTAVTSVDLFLRCLFIYLNFHLTVKGRSPGIKYTDNMYIIEYKSWLFHLE